MWNFERDNALSIWLWRTMTILSYWIGRSDRSLKLVFLFFSCFWRLIWYELWMMIPQVKYSYPYLIPSKMVLRILQSDTFCFIFHSCLYVTIILLVDLGLWWPDGCRTGKYLPNLLIFSWTRTVWSWIIMHVLCCTFACWYLYCCFCG